MKHNFLVYITDNFDTLKFQKKRKEQKILQFVQTKTTEIFWLNAALELEDRKMMLGVISLEVHHSVRVFPEHNNRFETNQLLFWEHLNTITLLKKNDRLQKVIWSRITFRKKNKKTVHRIGEWNYLLALEINTLVIKKQTQKNQDKKTIWKTWFSERCQKDNETECIPDKKQIEAQHNNFGFQPGEIGKKFKKQHLEKTLTWI